MAKQNAIKRSKVAAMNELEKRVSFAQAINTHLINVRKPQALKATRYIYNEVKWWSIDVLKGACAYAAGSIAPAGITACFTTASSTTLLSFCSTGGCRSE